jgi:hypothetical protein
MMLAGLVMLLVVVGAFLAPIGAARLLVQTLEARLGGQVRLTLSPAVFGPRPAVEIEGIGWRPSGADDDALSIASVRLETDWWAREGTRPVSIHLHDARLELHQTPQGEWRLPRWADGDAAGGAAGGAGMNGFVLTQISLANVRLRLVPQAGGPLDLSVDAAELIPEGTRWRLGLTGRVAHALGQWAGPVVAQLKPAPGGMQVDTLSIGGDGRLGALGLSALAISASALTLEASAIDAGAIDLGVTLRQVPGLTGSARLQAGISAVHVAEDGAGAMVDALDLTHEGEAPLSVAMRSMRWTRSSDGMRLEPLRGTVRLTYPEAAIEVDVQTGALDHALATGRLSLAGLRLQLRLPDPKAPGQQVTVLADLSGDGQPAEARAAGQLRLVAEGSTAEAHWSFDGAQDPPVRVVARVDRLDLDRWRPTSGDSGEPAPLAVWRDWPVHGELRVDRLSWHGVEVDGARVSLGSSAPP